MDKLLAEKIAGPEWAEWYALTPQERFRESMKLWDTYLALEVRLTQSLILRALSSIEKNGAMTSLMAVATRTSPSAF